MPRILLDRVLVRADATGVAAPINFGEYVHAPVNFHTLSSDCFYTNVQIMHL